MLNKLKKQKIDNIVIFVCDSLRWDYTPSSISNSGLTIKTIASSLYTASSFPSMISGLYPPKTGVNTWEDKLPKATQGLLNLDHHTSSLWCETTWTNLPPDKSAIHNILGNPKGISLEEIEPPFIYIEDDKGGHCPYGFPFGEYMGGGCPEFFREYGKKGIKALINQYKNGIEQSVNQFKKRIETLEKRKLIQDTLIIFTSDHGELLGEYGGLTYHNRPPCPELVYVPTIFIHPSLKSQTDKDNVISHVDLFPTISSILGQEVFYQMDGTNLLQNRPSNIGLNFRFGGYFKSKSKIKSWLNYESSSVWDSQGGHIFHGLGRFRAESFFAFRMMIQKHSEFNFLLHQNKKFLKRYRDYRVALRHLSSTYLKYLNPKLTKADAWNLIDDYLNESKHFMEKAKIQYSIDKLKKQKLIGKI